ncbi:hypothetical protein P175DRAFT_0502104 [Aspergillus ochraceoroseus IBT 24754]|uniref:Amidohydrolase-related domain-containing protein n=1 Tax=Aspergillus ochraceoroseus IBT 24754 TaxID=1392256 RepID=A0A2T5LUJ8_9EURO|nr:uncharacterized protein P175DRAFT_0502104 [Aspergillus ochraceoroseus IBT 24754]PTU19954.1 hypothetical protein P175DRAFT_0502104 [Aspergillus ochraceoroseus IBT 24754]
MTSKATLLRKGTVLYHDDDDKVTPLKNTDILIEGDSITKIGVNLEAPSGAEIVDCTDKIISPGFIDTHHHLWQTQLKGCHSEDSLLDYFPHGLLPSHFYDPEDTYWGQLTGALEAINSGTTFVLDHAHGCKTKEHVRQALSACSASGIRAVFAYATALRLEKWDTECCVPSQESQLEESIQDAIELAAGHPLGEGRIQIGYGFDAYYLPKEVVISVFTRLRAAGVKLITSHVVKSALFGSNSIITTLSNYGLLTPDLVLSHCITISEPEKQLLRNTQVPVSATPETESRMAMGWPLSFAAGINYTFGVDCHSSNSASLIQMCRLGISMARQERFLPLISDGKFPSRVPPSGAVAEGFRAMTIGGARAVGLGEQIGSLREGKRADLVVFDAASVNMAGVAEFDPVVAVVNHSEGADILSVMIDGKWRKRDGKLVPVPVPGPVQVPGQVEGQSQTWEQVREEFLESQRKIRRLEQGVSMERAREMVMQIFHADQSVLVDVV